MLQGWTVKEGASSTRCPALYAYDALCQDAGSLFNPTFIRGDGPIDFINGRRLFVPFAEALTPKSCATATRMSSDTISSERPAKYAHGFRITLRLGAEVFEWRSNTCHRVCPSCNFKQTRLINGISDRFSVTK
jgi:hypothetical protein